MSFDRRPVNLGETKGRSAEQEVVESSYSDRNIKFSLRSADAFPVVASLPPKNSVCEPERQNDFRDVKHWNIGLFGKLIVLLMLAVYTALQGPSCFFFLITPIACFCSRRCSYSRPFFSSSGAGKTILWSLQTHRSPNKKQLKGVLSVSVHRKVKYIILTQNFQQERLKLEAGR